MKNLIGIALSIIILIIVLIIGSVYMLHRSLPMYSGEIEVANLEESVHIYRDEFGVAYIDSKNELDAYYALGYVHAQERLFQMDISRRAGEGRLSELFGNSAVFFDKMFRTIGIHKIARANFEKYDEHTKNILINYTNGINEFIKNSPEKYTVEFDILGYNPYLWKPEHSLIIAKLMAWELNISWWSDIAFTHLTQRLGEEKVKDILPDYEENTPTIIPKHIKEFADIPIDLIKIDKDYREFIGAVGTHIGSNNWVVNGKKSITGKPIIANDPHLGFTSPGKWFVASINSPTLKVDGFTIPGIPGIVIGKNENISWVLTNVMADDADFYLEKLDSLEENYFIDGTWQPLEISTDTITVKDSSDVVFTIRKNHRGPIVSDIHTYNKLFPNVTQSATKISMRWTALEFSNELFAFGKINRAKNWGEFREGLEFFESPGQNFVYADSDGNIGYTAGVKLPLKKEQSSSFVYDGSTSNNDWIGYVTFKENPNMYNPEEGYIASANNKTIADYPYHISNVWEPKSRIERIIELIESKEKHGIDDFKNYQNDFYSHYSKTIVPYILSACKEEQKSNKKLLNVMNLLVKWNFTFEAESQVPTIYAVFFQYLLKNIFEDELGEELFNEYVFLANIPYRVVPNLLEGNNSSWFDNISTTPIENRDTIIKQSMLDALKFLEDKLGAKIEDWQWGKIHTVTFKHFFHGKSIILDKILDIGPFPIGGDGTTVFNSEYSFNSPYENKLGPSMRFIYDFSNPDIIEFILPTGQSGHFFSDHYSDMSNYWLNGEYVQINTNIDSIKNRNYEFIKMLPKRL